MPETTTNKEVKIHNTDKERQWRGFYFQGGSHPFDKGFVFKGDMSAAIAEFRRHCKVMNYKFLLVRPDLVDLREQEQLKNHHPDWDEHKVLAEDFKAT